MREIIETTWQAALERVLPGVVLRWRAALPAGCTSTHVRVWLRPELGKPVTITRCVDPTGPADGAESLSTLVSMACAMLGPKFEGNLAIETSQPERDTWTDLWRGQVLVGRGVPTARYVEERRRERRMAERILRDTTKASAGMYADSPQVILASAEVMRSLEPQQPRRRRSRRSTGGLLESLLEPLALLVSGAAAHAAERRDEYDWRRQRVREGDVDVSGQAVVVSLVSLGDGTHILHLPTGPRTYRQAAPLDDREPEDVTDWVEREVSGLVTSHDWGVDSPPSVAWRDEGQRCWFTVAQVAASDERLVVHVVPAGEGWRLAVSGRTLLSRDHTGARTWTALPDEVRDEVERALWDRGIVPSAVPDQLAPVAATLSSSMAQGPPYGPVMETPEDQDTSSSLGAPRDTQPSVWSPPNGRVRRSPMFVTWDGILPPAPSGLDEWEPPPVPDDPKPEAPPSEDLGGDPVAASRERVIELLTLLVHLSSGHAKHGVEAALKRCEPLVDSTVGELVLAYADACDDLRRAASHVKPGPQQVLLWEAQRHLEREVVSFGGELVGAVGEAFDHSRHHAFAQEGTGERIVRVSTTGVLLDDRLVRAASVSVGGHSSV